MRPGGIGRDTTGRVVHLRARENRRAAPLARWLVPSRDQVAALILAGPICVLLAAIWPLAVALQGRPFLYASVRAGRHGRTFRLWKIRTMSSAPHAERVLGGAARGRVTRPGRWLRRTRIDELPQIFNILAGDMVFFGARPPLPPYVASDPDVYLPILKEPPGVTGLATVFFCHREARLLADGRTCDEVDVLYRRRCMGRKARLDRVFLGRRGVGLTLYVLALTLWRGPHAERRLRRIRHGIERRFGSRDPAFAPADLVRKERCAA